MHNLPNAEDPNPPLVLLPPDQKSLAGFWPNAAPPPVLAPPNIDAAVGLFWLKVALLPNILVLLLLPNTEPGDL